jgi:predicted O-methyltransferase YrrM
MKNKTTAYSLSDWLNYLTRDEVDELQRIAKKPRKKTPTIVNIGAGAGTSGLAFAEARPEADLYTIDIRPSGPLGGLEGERNAFNDAGLLHPTQILGDSKEVGVDWQLPVDVLFVDGDHSESGIRGDIEIWLPHVKRNGYIIFHDYNLSKWGYVKLVVDELMSKYHIVSEVDRIIVFKKALAKGKKETDVKS